MAFMNVTTVITDMEIDRISLDAAVTVVRRDRGHLDVLCVGIDHTQPGAYYAGANAITLQSGLVEAENDARKCEEIVKKTLDTYEVNWAAQAVSAQLTS